MCVCSTSLQQTVVVSVFHQVAVYGEVVQGLQGRALLHVLIGHRETGLGAVPHQTTTITHTHTRRGEGSRSKKKHNSVISLISAWATLSTVFE